MRKTSSAPYPQDTWGAEFSRRLSAELAKAQHRKVDSPLGPITIALDIAYKLGGEFELKRSADGTPVITVRPPPYPY